MASTYHNGKLLEGDLPISIIWYGKFSPAQKSILLEKSGRVSLSREFSDKNCSIGKNLKRSRVSELARKANLKPGELALVLTAQDVIVEGFCMSVGNCGFHGSDLKHKFAFLWVGNSESQCPGKCTWPFLQPIYGPQTSPLVVPNDDVGVDGMIVNIASLLAGTVMNPYGNGYYLRSSDALLEAALVCLGVYGKGACPGYAGELLLDSRSGASYNALGVSGRKFLLPSLFNPTSSVCSTNV
ncbi:hypothetical protein UlMin_035164 [Ulmus minor]